MTDATKRTSNDASINRGPHRNALPWDQRNSTRQATARVDPTQRASHPSNQRDGNRTQRAGFGQREGGQGMNDQVNRRQRREPTADGQQRKPQRWDGERRAASQAQKHGSVEGDQTETMNANEPNVAGSRRARASNAKHSSQDTGSTTKQLASLRVTGVGVIVRSHRSHDVAALKVSRRALPAGTLQSVATRVAVLGG